MAKQSPTVRFIAEKVKRIPSYACDDRLYYPLVRDKFHVSYANVAEFIKGDGDTHDYLLDTNFFTDHEVDDCVWDALADKRITFTAGVWEELVPWRNNPFYNKHIVPILNNARNSGSARILFDHPGDWGIPCGSFRSYYVDLLAQRKRKAKQLVDEFIQERGREPTLNELNHLFQKAGNERDFHIFRKGCEEINSGRNIFTDEELVATAAMITLGAGANTTILTRDHDVFEQFYKLTGLLTIHYQATLFAARYAEKKWSFMTHPVPKTPEVNHYFSPEESFLVKKPVDPDGFVAWLLPNEFKPLNIRCVLFTGNGNGLCITPLSYACEKAMLRLLEAKGNTGGLNTDQLSGLNCHVTGFPKGIMAPRDWVIIGKDRLATSPDGHCKFPLLDLAHATTHFEELKCISSTVT